MVLSVFGARLVQLQGVDPPAVRRDGAAEGMVRSILPAERGDILDRNGEPLADLRRRADGRGRPLAHRRAGAGAGQVPRRRLDVDYFTILPRLREEAAGSSTSRAGSPPPCQRRASPRPRSPASRASAPAATRCATTRPATSPPTCRLHRHRRPGAGRHRARPSTGQLAAPTGRPRYAVDGGEPDPARREHHRRARRRPRPAHHLDLDLQWYAQRVLRQTVEDARARLGLRAS